MSMVALNSVSKSYGEKDVLHYLSLTVEKGERLAVLGPSGCGKTTLLRLIAGFVAPDKGEVLIEGEVVAKDGAILKPPEERGIGMVFQDLALWPHMSVAENVEFGLRAKGVSKEEIKQRTAEMLSLVGMLGFEKRKPSELSGGEQQRVALARALVVEPRVLLMDEPLSSLDPELNLRLRGEILNLHSKLGFTLIYVTHNREEALEIATKVVVMKAGRKIMEGTPEDLLRSPR